MELKVVFIVCFLPVVTIATVQEICELKGEYLTCPFGKVININTVDYGRSRLGFCNPYNVPNIPTNCHSTSVTENTVRTICQYRGSCFLEADNKILGEDPCPNIPKYLTIDFNCMDPTTLRGPTTTPTTTSSTAPSTSTTTTTTTTTPLTTTTTPTTTTTTPTTPTTTTRRTTPTTTSRTTTPTTTTTSITTTTTATTTTSTTTPPPTTTKSPVVPFVPFNAPAGSQICHDYLVGGKNGVPDGKLSASSVYQTANPLDNHGPDRGHLFSDAVDYPNGTYNRGGWAAAVDNQQQYIQVQLNAPSIVRGVATQGRHVNPNDLCCYQYVTRYRVMYSLDCVNFDTIQENGQDKIFTGNADQDSVVTNMLPCPVMARCVRINPVDWKDHISMRFDLLGCSANTADVGHCPNGWEQRPGSNQCYLITNVTDMRTRDDASAECQKQQGHLVKIDSIAERDWLRQKVAQLQQSQGQFHFWTGISNRPRSDNTGYVWEDGTPLDTYVMPWKSGQPDNGGKGEHCGELWSGELNDNDCNQHYPYICEIPKFWTPPKNVPSPFNTVVPTTRPTTQSTSTQAPPTQQPYKRPQLPGSQVIGGILFSAGCLGQASDCSFKPAGDYQSCQGCHYYMTCAPSGVFTRPCPANLVWDDNIKTCQQTSSTCGPVNGGCFNDCTGLADGWYQSCQGCHMYLSCAVSGAFHMPCPASQKWDSNKSTCQSRSSTCGPVSG